MTPTPSITDQAAAQAVQLAQQIQEPVKAMAQQVLQWAQQAGNFAQEQAPLIAQEIVAREMVRAGVTGVMAAIVASVLLYLSTKMDIDEGGGPVAIIGLLAAGVTALNLYWLLAAYVAPRLLVIEYLSGLLR